MAEATLQPDLLSPEFMNRLDRLDVISRKILRGKLQGERRSKKRGQSVEFADYRNYVVGDDLRFIDWNLYARLDRLFLRLFMEEEDLSVNIVLDVSRSMDFGDPSKLQYARQLAAALGYIGLTHYNRVGVYTFANGVRDQITNLRGRRPIPRLMDFLTRAEADPKPVSGNLTEALRTFALAQRTPGVVILVSDFFDKGELTDALRYLGQERLDPYAIQVLSPQEVSPDEHGLLGDLKLKDLEDDDIAEVSVTPALVKRYKANLQEYCKYVNDQCSKRGIAYMVSETSVPFETVVLKYLRERGLLG